MTVRMIAGFAAMAFAAWVSAQAGDDCQLKRMATFEMNANDISRVVIPASIGGKPLSLIVDTGSAHSMLAERTVGALGLRRELFAGSMVSLWGGVRITSYVNVDGMQLGHLMLGRSQLYIIPDQYMSLGSDGLLGSDVMSRFDADFDFASGRLNLMSKDHCRGKVVYWTDDSNVAIVPFQRSPMNASMAGRDWKKILLTVTVDGKEFRAALDTGAPHTSLNLDEAEAEFGLTPQSPGMQAVRHGDGTSYLYRFKSMSFGGVSVANPEIVLDPYAVNKMPGSAPTILIGMNVLRKLHLYVAYDEEKLYISQATAH